jgi:hypothetical protein
MSRWVHASLLKTVSVLLREQEESLKVAKKPKTWCADGGGAGPDGGDGGEGGGESWTSQEKV